MRQNSSGIPLWPFHLCRLKRALKAWDIDPIHLGPVTEALQPALGSDQLHRVKLIVGLNAEHRLIHQIFRSPLDLRLAPRRFLHMRLSTARPASYKSTGHYSNYWLEHRQALALGADDVIYSFNNNLLECSMASLFCMRGEQRFCLDSPSLQSVCRDALIQVDPSWTRSALALSDLDAHLQLYAGNALRGLWAIGEIIEENGTPIWSQQDSKSPDSWNEALFANPITSS